MRAYRGCDTLAVGACKSSCDLFTVGFLDVPERKRDMSYYQLAKHLLDTIDYRYRLGFYTMSEWIHHASVVMDTVGSGSALEQIKDKYFILEEKHQINSLEVLPKYYP